MHRDPVNIWMLRWLLNTWRVQVKWGGLFGFSIVQEFQDWILNIHCLALLELFPEWCFIWLNVNLWFTSPFLNFRHLSTEVQTPGTLLPSLFTSWLPTSDDLFNQVSRVVLPQSEVTLRGYLGQRVAMRVGYLRLLLGVAGRGSQHEGVARFGVRMFGGWGFMDNVQVTRWTVWAERLVVKLPMIGLILSSWEAILLLVHIWIVVRLPGIRSEKLLHLLSLL